MTTASRTDRGAGAVFGRYVLVERIGRGAMGEVWVAIDPDLDRKVAVKLLRGDRLERADDRARLDTEARLMARLSHPNVVTIHDVGTIDEQLFIAMEHVDGETLDRWIARGPHPWTEVVAIMRQAAAGLAAAHAVGLVHRDFKPANVMLGGDGRVRVLDFGLARPEGAVAGGEAGATARSVTLDSDDGDPGPRARLGGGRRIQGSPAYMAPEQHRGAVVDARSDLFSFCVSLFEALYGARPFHGNNRLAVALAIVEGRMIELRPEQRERVPEWIHAIVLRGLAVDPDRRFADMDELLAALERSPAQRRRRRLQLGALLIGGVAIVAGGFALRPEPAADPCADAGAAIVELWRPDARASLANIAKLANLANSTSRVDGLAGQRLVEGVDRHADAWAAASGQLCRDRNARRSTERLQAIREACLAQQRARLAALLRLTSGDPAFARAVAARPFAAVRALGEPSGCVDRPALGEESSPVSVESLAAMAELELWLALVDELPGQLASRLGAAIPSDAEQQPELALLRARLARARGQLDEAAAGLHEAAAMATSGDPQLAARAWLELIALELARSEAATEPGERAASLERATALLGYADALLPAYDAAARAELGLLAGRLALASESSESPALLDAGLAGLADDPLQAPDLALAAHELRAQLHERAGRGSAAADDRSRAEQLRRAAFGYSMPTENR